MSRSRLHRAVSLALSAAAAACAPSAPRPAPGPQVAVATIAPLADLVQRVAGPEWTVRSVIPPGTSPHVFEPEPSDLRKLLGARAVFVAGAGYDDWMRKVLAACASRAPVHDAAKSLGIGPGHAWAEGAGHEAPAETGDAHGEEAHEHTVGSREEDDHAGHDHDASGTRATGTRARPTGPSREGGRPAREGLTTGTPTASSGRPALVAFARLAARSLAGIAEAFAAVDPIHAEAYRSRAREGRRSSPRSTGRSRRGSPRFAGRFVSAHRAWAYFADRYGSSRRPRSSPCRDGSPRLAS
jgi:ABC-type metal ion transport system, periplasmic component/surface adhesin